MRGRNSEESVFRVKCDSATTQMSFVQTTVSFLTLLTTLLTSQGHRAALAHLEFPARHLYVAGALVYFFLRIQNGFFLEIQLIHIQYWTLLKNTEKYQGKGKVIHNPISQ